ncbi:MAG: hypothetical protein HQK67_07660 [Desulfamplus sp.]|nr:hypothetical protein [Desulfamplus sp.]
MKTTTRYIFSIASICLFISFISLSSVLVLISSDTVHAAVGCDLNDPDKDVARLFPDSTGYKTFYMSIDKKGGDPLVREIEKRLGDKFKGLYETADVPYTVYEIYKGTEKTGYIHGVNQKGQYGGIQVFLSLDMEGNIRNFYFQKLTSRAARVLREKSFGLQFVGLNLADFYNYDIQSGKNLSPGKLDNIQNPSLDAESDFRAALRATKKNLILMDEFVFDNKYLKK